MCDLDRAQAPLTRPPGSGAVAVAPRTRRLDPSEEYSAANGMRWCDARILLWAGWRSGANKMGRPGRFVLYPRL
jgi:hypothetical protein